MAFFPFMATCGLSLVGTQHVYVVPRYHGCEHQEKQHGKKERVVNSGLAAPYPVVVFGLQLLCVDVFKISGFQFS